MAESNATFRHVEHISKECLLSWYNSELHKRSLFLFEAHRAVQSTALVQCKNSGGVLTFAFPFLTNLPQHSHTTPPRRPKMPSLTKQQEVVLFSSTAIALYGYDQGMMSLINTNHNYLATMGIAAESPIVGILVAVYYLGCSLGAVLFSRLSDTQGRKRAIFACLATASLGNLLMFLAGLGGGWGKSALHMFWIGRVIMGLGVGGVDSVIPVYSAELSADHARGKALAQEFQMNIFGLNMAFGINLAVTETLGKASPWAWRIPIVVMQAYPAALFLVIGRLPESPRWFIFQDRKEDAKEALVDIYGEGEGEAKTEELLEKHEQEKDDHVGYLDMITPGHATFHPTVITVMGQVNQALTGYGAVSVYGPQIFEVSESIGLVRHDTMDNSHVLQLK